jgi:chromosome segregation ATPase
MNPQISEDVHSLRRENDLLAVEVQVVRARASGHRQEVEDLEAELAAARRQNRELERARRDLTRLLERLGRRPQGWIFRRLRAFRRLEERWLRED